MNGGILSLVGLLIYGVLRVLVHSCRLAAKNYDKKLSEDYVRAVEKHQLSDMRMSTYTDPPPKRKEYALPKGGAVPNDNSTEYRIKTNKASRAKVIDKASRSGGDYPTILGEEYPYWKESITDNHYSPDEVETINYQSQFDGAGHGGSFGGGGASGSWGSDDNNSSSSYDSSSSDSGGSDSSSSD